MSKNTSSFMIGLFVTLGIVIGVIGAIWLSATQYFEKGAFYVTYFDESVQGLQKDSIVKYRGVEAGRVEEIRVAADNRLIEVVMKIDLEGDLERENVSQLRFAGITGIVFVDLDRRDEGDPDLSPRLSFASEYPIIPSRPSERARLVSGFDKIMAKVKEIDLKGISDRMKSTLDAGEKFLAGDTLSNTMSNLESATARLESAIGKIDRMIAEGRLADVMAEAKGALVDARSLIEGLKEEIESMNLAETAGKAGRMVEGVDREVRAIAVEIRATSENLRRASENLERLLERLSINPSDVIFSAPPLPGRDE